MIGFYSGICAEMFVVMTIEIFDKDKLSAQVS